MGLIIGMFSETINKHELRLNNTLYHNMVLLDLCEISIAQHSTTPKYLDHMTYIMSIGAGLSSSLFCYINYKLYLNFAVKCLNKKWTVMRENLSLVVSKKQMRRPACTSAQSDQPLCCSLFLASTIS